MSAAANAHTSQADDLDQVRDLLLAMLGEGRTDEAVALVIELLAAMRSKNTELALRLERELRHRYGRRSEGVTSEQLSLFLGRLPDVGEAGDGEIDDDGRDEPDEPDEPATRPRKPPRRTGRRPLPPELPREEHVVALDDAQLVCAGCGEDKSVFGHERSEVA